MYLGRKLYRMNRMGMDRIEMKPVRLFNPRIEDGRLRCSAEDGDTVVKVNPFRNLLEMITFYYGVAERNDPDELDAFLDNVYSPKKDKYPKLIDAEDMDYFILQSIADSMFQNNSQSKNEPWMDFDEDKLKALLRNKFFKEYNKKVLHRLVDFKKGKLLYEKDGNKVYEWAGDFTPDLSGMSVYARDYGMLELYTYTKLQAQAACLLSNDRTDMMWDLWCYHDVIEQLYTCRFYDCITKGIDFRSRANKVANLFSRIARQKCISKEHEDCISLLHEYLDSILQAIIGGRHASSFKRAAPLFMLGYLIGRTLIMRILILIGLHGVQKIY